MDKKLLVSLMMTAPVSVFAAQWVGNGNGNLSYKILAEVNQANWKADGVSENYGTVDGKLVCPTQTGFLYHEADLKVKGTYTLNATGLTENAYFKVNGETQYKLNAQGQHLDANGNVTTKPAEYAYEYNLKITQNDPSKKIRIDVCPINKDLEFAVGDLVLSFYFDFATAKSMFQTQFGKIELNQVANDDNRSVAKGLNAEYKTLDEEYDKISGWINSIDLSNGESLVTAFNTYHLGSFNANFSKAADDVSNAIRNLQGTAGVADAAGNYPAGSYNARVADEIKAWNNIKLNRTNLAALEAKISQLKADLKAKENVANSIDPNASANLKEYCKLALASELKTEDDAITALENAVKDAYPKDTEGNLPTYAVPSVTFNATADQIKVDIAAISYDNAVADWTAYGQFLKDVVEKLEFDYNKIWGQVNFEYRITEYYINGEKKTVKNVYDDVTGDANNELATAYKENIDYDINYTKLTQADIDAGKTLADINWIPGNYANIIDARLNLSNAEAEMNIRLDGMKAAETKLKGIYDNQQEALNGDGGANDVLAGLQTTLDECKAFADSDAFKSLKEGDKTALSGYITAMQNALNKLCNTTNDEYKAHTLDVNADPFAADKAAFDAQKTNYDNYLTTNIGQTVVDLLVSSNGLRKHVTDQTATVKNNTLGVNYSSDLFDKFVSSMDNIDKAIKEYYETPVANRKPQAVTDINTGIDDVWSACDKLVLGFNKALSALASAQNANNEFANVIKNKLLIGDGEEGKYDTTPDVAKKDAFAAQINGFKETLKSIATNTQMNVQEAYDAANNTTGQVTAADLPSKIATAQGQFVTAASTQNSVNVDKMLKQIKKYTEDAPYKNYPGMDEVDLDKDITDGYGRIEDAYNTTVGVNNSKITEANNDVAKLAAIDNGLKSIVDKCTKVNAKIQNVLDNHAAYVSLKNLKDSYYNAIYRYSQNLTTLTVNPAVQHYIGELSDLLDDLNVIEADFGGTASKPGDYYKVNLSNDELALSYKNKLDAVGAANASKFAQLQEDVLANQAAYSKLLNISDALSLKINGVNDTLNNYDANDTSDSGVYEYTQKYKDELAELITKLGNFNDEVTASFGEGGLIDSELVSSYVEEYGNITNWLQEIIDAWTDGYHSAVVDANNAWLKTYFLGSDILDIQYKDAVAYVNDYLYKVYNVNFYPMLVDNETFIENHNELQKNFKKIEKLNYQLNRFIDYITPASTDPASQKVLLDRYGNYGSRPVEFEGQTETVTLQTRINAAASINQNIIDCLNAIDGVAEAKANEFWNANGQIAVNAWGTISNRLASTGFTTEEIDSYYGTELSEIQTIKETYDADIAALPGTVDADGRNAAVHKYVLDMDDFAQMIAGLEVTRKAGYPLLPEYGERDQEDVDNYVDGKVYTAVNDLWSTKSADTASTLNDLLEEISKYAFESASGSYNNNRKVITDALADLADLVEDWADLSNPSRESTLPTNLGKLDKFLTDADNALTSAKNNYDVYFNNQEVLKAVIGQPGDVTAYNTAILNIDELLAWSSYRSEFNFNQPDSKVDGNYDELAVIDGLREDLETAKNTVIGNVASEVSKYTVALGNAAINKVGVTDVNAAYGKIFNLEKNYANSLLVILRTAFNNVNLQYSADGIDEDEQAKLNEWDSKINTYSTNVFNLNFNVNNPNKGLMTTLKDYEAKISKLIVELQGIAKYTNTEADTKNYLAEQYTAATTSINSFIEQVNNAKRWGGDEAQFTIAEQTKYVGLANDLQNTLDSYRSGDKGFENVGANVIQDAAEYSWHMSQLVDVDFAEVTKGWNDAYKVASKKDYSNFHFNELETELQKLLADTDYAKNEAVAENEDSTNKNPHDYSTLQYNDINNQINGYTDAVGYHKGLLKTFQDKAATWDITSNDYIPTDLTNLVYGFVRNTLYTVADLERANATDNADYLMDVVKVPGKNENGWDQSFIDADKIVDDILQDQIALNAIDLRPNTCTILKYPYYISNVLHYGDTNPDQAKAAYLNILQQIDELNSDINKIYDEAVRDNLIVKGDVNDDKKINILDVQKLIDIVLDQEEFDAQSKESHVKDVNSDEEINVGDVTMLINWVIDGQNNRPQAVPSKLAKFMKSFSGSNNSYRVEEVVGENGYRRFAMLLTNETAFAAGQLNIKLPSHASVAGVHLGDRANALDVYVKDNGNFTTVVMTALDNSMIEGNNGCVLFIDIDGNAEVQVENVIFSDAKGNSYKLSDATNGVDGIYESIKDGVKSIYNAAGQKLRNLTKGVNIIRNADGTTTKKIGK